MKTLDYCKAGVTPEFKTARVFNTETGEEYKFVTEVNATEGWLIQLARDSAGTFIQDGSKLKTQKIAASIRIECGDICD